MDQQLGDNNTELTQALQEFETKFSPDASNGLEQQGIDQAVSYSSAAPVDETPKMVRAIISHSGGLIKDEKQANYVLLAFTIGMFALAAFFFFKGSL